MAERIVLCIEPDSATVDEIRRELSAVRVRDREHPQRRRGHRVGALERPALIILSVEPRKVGYAICNKLKRSPSLRDIPLILISSEETLATFEQHKKLKSRADEYLLKPLDAADLLAKVDRLLGLGARQQTTDEMDVQNLDDDADILIADDEDIAIIGNMDDAESENDERLAGLHTGSSGPVVRYRRGHPRAAHLARGRAGFAVRGREVRSRDAGGLRRARGRHAGRTHGGRRHGRSAEPVVGR